MENDFSVHSTGNSSEKKSPENFTFLDNEISQRIGNDRWDTQFAFRSNQTVVAIRWKPHWPTQWTILKTDYFK